MSVDWEDERCRRLVLEGRREAVLRGNLEVVELFNHNRRLGKAPNVEMVRFAVFEGGCDRSIVYDTMAAARIWNLRGDAWKDEELDNWCEERIKNGDPKGIWLKLKLEELMTTKIVGEDNTITADGVKVIPGQMHPNTGNYDNVVGDKLVVRSLKWNQVSFAISLILGRRLREHIRFLFLGPELATIWMRGVLIHRNYAPLRGPATIPVKRCLNVSPTRPILHFTSLTYFHLSLSLTFSCYRSSNTRVGSVTIHWTSLEPTTSGWMTTNWTKTTRSVTT